MADISFQRLSKTYSGNVAVVTDFNLEVKDKEFIVLVGPSGCGKSTTLRMIAGLEEISKGDLFIGDKNVNNVPPKDRDIAMVFQNYALYPHMNVYENLAVALKLRKFKKADIKRRVEEAADTLGLTEMLDRKPKAMSGGQRQRVALGRAIVRNPKVFLMDEPLSNLDAKLRVQMRAEITKLHQKLQTTTIYVTHDQTEAMTMATRMVVMKDGVIQQVGSPKDIYDYPDNIFIGGFIGSPAMNFLNGTLRDGYFEIDHLKVKIPEEKLPLVEQYNNKEILLGIRPEDIHDKASFEFATEEAILPAKIEVAELMGSETFLYSKISGQNLIARVDSRTDISMGDTLPMGFNMDKVHFFDPESESRITAVEVQKELAAT